VTSRLNSKLLYHVTAFIVVAIWGSTFVFTKLLLLAGLTPAQIFTLRFIIAYVLLLGWTVYREWKKGNQISHPSSFTSRLFCNSWRDELLMVALGVTGGSLYFLTENSSMNYTTTTNTSLIVSLSPLVATFLISLFYQSQRLNRVQIVGTLMAALGVVIVVLNGHFVLHLSPLGDSLAFGAALCWGFYSLLMIPAGQRYDTAFVTRKVFFYGLLSMIPYYVLRPEETWIFTSSVFNFFSSSDKTSIFQFFSSSILLNLLFLGCIASMGCFLAWNWVLKKLGAVVATNYVYFNPVTTILFAWAILSEQITVFFLLGTVLILQGMYLADRKK
jgi:drug/metabolite transporter (DMT)-like permease